MQFTNCSVFIPESYQFCKMTDHEFCQ